MLRKECIDIRNHIVLKFSPRDIDVCLSVEAICIRRRCVTRSLSLIHI